MTSDTNKNYKWYNRVFNIGDELHKATSGYPHHLRKEKILDIEHGISVRRDKAMLRNVLHKDFWKYKNTHFDLYTDAER